MPETGKDRSSRIEMDYYRQRGGLSRWKVRLSIFGLVVGIGVMVYAFSDSRSTNPGFVIEGHASFEQNCEACHKALTPIANDSLRSLEFLGISEQTSVEHTFTACTSCHNGTSHPIQGHHRAKMKSEGQLHDKNCVTCHADHQGRGHDLTLVQEAQCTSCHSDLSVVRSVAGSVRDTNIASFSNHPDFASLQNGDPGSVKFDHAQHLRPGQPSVGKDVIRIRDLEPKFRERYRRQMEALKAREPAFSEISTGDEALVQLDCQSCHQLEGIVNETVTGNIAGAANFAPIDFDLHCAACHSINPSGRAENTLAIPHAATWTEIDLWLRAKSQRPAVGVGLNPTGIGGFVESPPENSDEAKLSAGSGSTEVARIQHAREGVRQQCLKCHEPALLASDETIMAASANDAKPLIPSRWLVHGRYDHGAHATIECRVCHPQPYETDSGGQTNEDNNSVMILGIETCNGCHRPVGTPNPSKLLVGDQPNALFGQQSLWASDRCMMCHTYHGGTGSKNEAGSKLPDAITDHASLRVLGRTLQESTQ